MVTPRRLNFTPGIRYDKMVEALGGYGELVERPEDIRPALERAFASGLPACVNVLIDPKTLWSLYQRRRIEELYDDRYIG